MIPKRFTSQLKNINRGLLWVIVGLLAVALGVGLYVFFPAPIPLDNTTPAEERTDRRYSDQLLYEIEVNANRFVSLRGKTIRDVQRMFDVRFDFKRESETGTYYILISEDGGREFFFTDSDGYIQDVVYLQSALDCDQLRAEIEKDGKLFPYIDEFWYSELCNRGNNWVIITYLTDQGLLEVNFGTMPHLRDGGEIESMELTPIEEEQIPAGVGSMIFAEDVRDIPVRHIYYTDTE